MLFQFGAVHRVLGWVLTLAGVAVLVTASIPVLGSGKIDYPATQTLAATMRPLL